MIIFLTLTLIVGIIAILHHSVAYVSFEIIEKCITFYKLMTLYLFNVFFFFFFFQMIGGTLTAVVHNVGVAAVLMLKVENKRPRNYCLNKFYFRHVSAISDAI